MPYKLTEAVCPICGKTFTQRDPRRPCCSQECGRKLRTLQADKNHPARVCPVCGKEFRTTSAYRGRICCSDECANIRRTQQHWGKYVPTPADDVSGQTINGLTALRFIGHNRWEWRCFCGQTFKARAASVKSGATRSCGCLFREHARQTAISRRDKLDSGLISSIINGKLRSTNTTGVTGVIVRHNVASVVYVARITVDGKEINLGRFATLEEAARARKKAEDRYFAPRVKGKI